jgi:C4-dicarboxylate-specific signal transduction histidine kinase
LLALGCLQSIWRCPDNTKPVAYERFTEAIRQIEQTRAELELRIKERTAELRHAMPTGGTVTIRAGPTDDQQVQITFQDTGCGMSPEILARAFEPFYSTKGEQGTGLGLAICRQIIDNHRGTIRLDSTPGAGTIVIITLPRADATRQ